MRRADEKCLWAGLYNSLRVQLRTYLLHLQRWLPVSGQSKILKKVFQT